MSIKHRLARIATAAVVAAATFVFAPLIGEGIADAAPACGITYGVAGYPDWEGLSLPDGYVKIQHAGGIFGIEPWAHWNAYNATVDQTASILVDHLNWASTHVEGNICVFGHSLGASIVTEAAIRVNSMWYAPRVQVLTTGNPKSPGGLEDTFNGVWIGPGIHFTGPYHPWQINHLGSFTNQCHFDDVICHAENPLFNIGGFLGGLNGYLFAGAHTSYGVHW